MGMVRVLVALLAFSCIGCSHRSRTPDITGFITALPGARLRVESNTTDPVHGRPSPKAVVSLAPGIDRSNLRVGCLVQVWYDPKAPIKESYPVQVVAEAVRVVKCHPQGEPGAITGARVPGGCDIPVAKRTDEVGCYLLAADALDSLPAGPLYWHIYGFPTLQAAVESAEQVAAVRFAAAVTVVESFGRAWLFALARADWNLTEGKREALVGPLPTPRAARYVARYMEAVFPPGMQTSIHRHSGPEAWYLVSGGQCLQTPDTTIIVRAGASAVVPAGPPMRLTGIGVETRRSLFLVLHDASQTWMAVTTDWKPDREC